jgi:hypothetical protein
MTVEYVNCAVCGCQACTRMAGVQASRFECARCGIFVLTISAEATIEGLLAENPLRRSLMSYALRRMQRPGVLPEKITTSQLPSFWSDERLPTLQVQIDNLLIWIGDNQKTSLDYAVGAPTAIAAYIGIPISAAGDVQALSWLRNQIDYQPLLEQGSDQNEKLSFRLTLFGSQKYEQLRKASRESRTAFMALRFGDPVLDDVVENCFKPAVLRTGFELRKLSDKQPAGLIDNQIRAAILSGRFVIADLSHANDGAYWEAGYAEGLGLPVIYTCEEGVWNAKKTHFDTNHMVTIIWNAANLAAAGDNLTATIRATFRSEAKQTDD